MFKIMITQMIYGLNKKLTFSFDDNYVQMYVC